VESEWQKDVGASEPVVRSTELKLGQQEGMAQVQQAILVGVGEVAEELFTGPWRSAARISLENLALVPGTLDL